MSTQNYIFKNSFGSSKVDQFCKKEVYTHKNLLWREIAQTLSAQSWGRDTKFILLLVVSTTLIYNVG